MRHFLLLLAACRLHAQLLSTVSGTFTYPSGPALQRPLPHPAEIACSADACYIATAAGILKLDSASNLSLIFGPAEAKLFGGSFPISPGAGLAVDSAGNLYFTYLRYLLRRTPSGALSQVAGGSDSCSPCADNIPAAQARFGYLTSIAIDGAGNIYLYDQARIRKITTAGIITAFAGTGSLGNSGDGGPALAASLLLSGPIAAESNGTVYVGTPEGLRKISTAGIITTVATGSIAAVAVDATGAVFFTDNAVVKKLSPGGQPVLYAGGGASTADNIPALSAQLLAAGLGVDSAGNLLVSDWNPARIRKVNAAGAIISTVAGNGSMLLDAVLAPRGVAIDPQDNLLVTDGEGYIHKFSPEGTRSTMAGNGIYAATGDRGLARNASVSPSGPITVDSASRVIFSDFGIVRVIDSGGIIDVFTQSGMGLGGLAADSAGNVYISQNTGDFQFYKLSRSGILSIAASGGFGYTALAADKRDNIYFHTGSGAGTSIVQRLTPAGVVSTIAGGRFGPDSGDGGPAVLARFPGVQAIAADSRGQVFLATGSPIRKIDTAGIITTIAGGGSGDPNLDGVSASSVGPLPIGSMVFDSVDNLYFVMPQSIRKITFNTVLRSVSPAQTPANAAFTLEINGSGFLPQSIARWNGSNRPTLYVNPTRLRVQMAASDVASTGPASITVATPDIAVSNALSLTVTASANGSLPSSPTPADTTVISPGSPVLTWSAPGASTFDVYFGTNPDPPRVATVSQPSYSAGALPPGVTYFWRIAIGSTSGPLWRFTTSTTVPELAGKRFVPIVPCRVADTRAGEGFTGALGPPTIAASASRDLPIRSGRCGLPASAAAYSLNVTVVPLEPLAYLTLWPSGQARPLVSTLNSFHGGVVANAAIVPAGTNGAVSAFSTGRTEMIVDINGYFDAASPGGYPFYSITPCRLTDTRLTTLPPAGSTRDYPVAGRCGVPSTAAAYALNATVVPTAALSYLTLWPAGQPRPFVSTLNAYDGSVVANAALVPAGVNGSVSAFVTDSTETVLDISGYFAPSGGAGELRFFPVAPCRLVDTRLSGGPIAAGTARDFSAAGLCGIPGDAKAYSLNVTAVPPGPLIYLTLWPTGSTRPAVSTLNSFSGRVTANAALASSGTGGQLSVYVTNDTDVVLDVNGYFR